MSSIAEFREFLVKNQTLKKRLENDKDRLQQRRAGFLHRLQVLKEAQDVVNAVAILTVEELKLFIEECVSLCLAIVYGDEYKFELVYETKRGQPEASPVIVKGGERLSPRDEVGGGVIDVVSIALRLSLWMLSVPRTRSIFVFDEPFRFVSRDLTHKLVDMLREVCSTFGAQIIMVSHNDDLIDGADMTMRVSQEDHVSLVEVM